MSMDDWKYPSAYITTNSEGVIDGKWKIEPGACVEIEPSEEEKSLGGDFLYDSGDPERHPAFVVYLDCNYLLHRHSPDVDTKYFRVSAGNEVTNDLFEHRIATVRKIRLIEEVDLVHLIDQCILDRMRRRCMSHDDAARDLQHRKNKEEVAMTTQQTVASFDGRGPNVVIATRAKRGISASTSYDAYAYSTGKFDISAVSSAESMAAAIGRFSAAVSTDRYSSSAVYSDNSVALATGFCGKAACGAGGIAIASGVLGRVMGYEIGAHLTAVEYEDTFDKDELKIKSIASGKVTGKKIKPNRWYKCVDGKLVECSEDPYLELDWALWNDLFR